MSRGRRSWERNRTESSSGLGHLMVLRHAGAWGTGWADQKPIQQTCQKTSGSVHCYCLHLGHIGAGTPTAFASAQAPASTQFCTPLSWLLGYTRVGASRETLRGAHVEPNDLAQAMQQHLHYLAPSHPSSQTRF